MYIAYDIKGIQQFIFSVPKLKYIVGGSLLIDAFDKEIENDFGDQTIFAGGGRGILKCSSKAESEQIKKRIVSLAHEAGLDLRIGESETFSEAVVGAEDLYPFIPDSLKGEPCSVSGLWPIEYKDSKGYTSEGKGIHPKIWERSQKIDKKSDQPSNQSSFDRTVIQELQKLKKCFPEELQSCQHLEFLTTVKSDEKMDKDINDEKKQEILQMQKKAERGSKVLGDRNRWAIVALDGNDMGSQFRAFEDSQAKKDGSGTSNDDKYKQNWYHVMSEALDACTREAFYHALAEVIAKWWEKEGKRICEAPPGEDLIILPFRPLILGGDDILCLSHPTYAMDLAKMIIEKFTELSKQKAEKAKENGIEKLWPGTSNELSISAGIVYTSVTQPLHMAIPYAESLLGSAKGKFRKERQGKNGETLPRPTPAAIDWEHITETMIDTPAARRQRDLTFFDEDLGNNWEVHLTKRPYKLDDLGKLLELKKELNECPKSLLAQCQEILRLPWAKRMQRLAAMRKQNSTLVDMIKDKELDGELGTRWEEESVENPTEDHPSKRTTSFLDAVMLLEEEHRMEQETVKIGSEGHAHD